MNASRMTICHVVLLILASAAIPISAQEERNPLTLIDFGPHFDHSRHHRQRRADDGNTGGHAAGANGPSDPLARRDSQGPRRPMGPVDL